jgi:hypothetical protein
MLIDAVNGSFQNYYNYYQSKLPQDTTVKVSEADAVKTAKERVAYEFSAKTALRGTAPTPTSPTGKEDTSVISTSEHEAAKRRAERRNGILVGKLLQMEMAEGEPPRLMIVNADAAMAEKGGDPFDLDWTRDTRLAWVIRLACKIESDRGNPVGWLDFEVWVDAATGRVIGVSPITRLAAAGAVGNPMG